MIYERLLRPLLFALDPETAHHFALAFLRATGPLLPKSADTTSPVTTFGLKFRHRIGLAAGLDKNGVALSASSVTSLPTIMRSPVAREASSPRTMPASEHSSVIASAR